ncbi:MAG: DUF1836 domain-containing protein [Clostridia bacterium]|nr:DUF1836 domain-containing protein [Clostridia bacterium]
MRYLPGTVIEVEDGRLQFGFANLSPLFSATKGLTLSQICEIAGIEPTTVQNWIKRGWVAHPENKRYAENHLARIIILGMLRGAFQLERIAVILRFVNGSADDRGDDIIPDETLYTHLCRIIDAVETARLTEPDGVRAAIEKDIADYAEPYPGAREKLTAALTVMTMAYIASSIKSLAEKMCDETIGN